MGTLLPSPQNFHAVVSACKRDCFFCPIIVLIKADDLRLQVYRHSQAFLDMQLHLDMILNVKSRNYISSRTPASLCFLYCVPVSWWKIDSYYIANET